MPSLEQDCDTSVKFCPKSWIPPPVREGEKNCLTLVSHLLSNQVTNHHNNNRCLQFPLAVDKATFMHCSVGTQYPLILSEISDKKGNKCRGTQFPLAQDTKTSNSTMRKNKTVGKVKKSLSRETERIAGNQGKNRGRYRKPKRSKSRNYTAEKKASQESLPNIQVTAAANGMKNIPNSKHSSHSLSHTALPSDGLTNTSSNLQKNASDSQLLNNKITEGNDSLNAPGSGINSNKGDDSLNAIIQRAVHSVQSLKASLINVHISNSDQKAAD